MSGTYRVFEPFNVLEDPEVSDVDYYRVARTNRSLKWSHTHDYLGDISAATWFNILVFL